MSDLHSKIQKGGDFLADRDIVAGSGKPNGFDEALEKAEAVRARARCALARAPRRLTRAPARAQEEVRKQAEEPKKPKKQPERAPPELGRESVEGPEATSSPHPPPAPVHGSRRSSEAAVQEQRLRDAGTPQPHLRAQRYGPAPQGADEQDGFCVCTV